MAAIYPPARPVPHAIQRWARAVHGILRCSFDPTTIDAWGKVIGASGSAIRQWCRLAGFRPKASLDFARLLRAVVISQGRTWEVYNLLNVMDERTMRKLFARGGLSDAISSPQPPDTMTFLAEQQFVRSEHAMLAIVALLRVDALEDSDGEGGHEPRLPADRQGLFRDVVVP
jgi:hypothetical protein